MKNGVNSVTKISTEYIRLEQFLKLCEIAGSGGQAKLMMVYQRIFAEYSMTAAQILLTRYTMQDEEARSNAQNTFEELLHMGAKEYFLVRFLPFLQRLR